MTPTWAVRHPQDQLHTGGLVAYPDEHTAREAAGDLGEVLVLLPAEALVVVKKAKTWRASTAALHAVYAEEHLLAASVDMFLEATE